MLKSIYFVWLYITCSCTSRIPIIPHPNNIHGDFLVVSFLIVVLVVNYMNDYFDSLSESLRNKIWWSTKLDGFHFASNIVLTIPSMTMKSSKPFCCKVVAVEIPVIPAPSIMISWCCCLYWYCLDALHGSRNILKDNRNRTPTWFACMFFYCSLHFSLKTTLSSKFTWIL